MTNQELISRHAGICHKACSFQLYEALSSLRNFAVGIPLIELTESVREKEEIYRQLLAWSIKGATDPKRYEVLSGLVADITSLADQAREYFLEQGNPALRLSKQQTINGPDGMLLKLQPDSGSQKLSRQLNAMLEESGVDCNNPDYRESHQRFRSGMFNWLLYNDRLSESGTTFFRGIFNSDTLGWYDRCVMVSALSLSIMRYFDIRKLELLFGCYESGNPQVKQRALIGILLILIMYDDRLPFYPEMAAKIRQAYATGIIPEKEVIAVIRQFIKARDTEKISKRLRDEIIPDIQKLRPGIEDKLDLKSILGEQDPDDKNPDWQNILGDSPELLARLEELSRMQLEGNDVFMSAFSLLKHFPFFDTQANWFLPFYASNPELTLGLDEEELGFSGNFSTSLEKAAYICNSDKYSFMFNLRMLPIQQKGMLLGMFNSELESMNEISDEDFMLDRGVLNATINTQYIQDLYRFFKLSPMKSGFTDVFVMPLELHRRKFLSMLFPDPSFGIMLADCFFDAGHYPDAAEAYQQLIRQEVNNPEVFQKAAYSFQKSGKYDAAIELYRKAELFDHSTTWVQKQMASCYQAGGKFAEALTLYSELLENDLGNKSFLMQKASCYLYLKDYRQALNLYYEIEFSVGNIQGIWRPIAWCLFVEGRFAEAEEYFNRIFETEQITKYDFMNFGHLLWVTNRRQKAVEMYLSSIRLRNGSIAEFLSAFNDDTPHLLRHGLDPAEIQLMIDHLRFRLND